MNKDPFKKLILCLIPVNCLIFQAVYAQETFKTANIDKNGNQVIEIIGGNYFFKPDHIIVKVNTPVELRVKKEKGFIPHNITMTEIDSGIEIEFEESLGTETITVKFTPTVKGKFAFYCDGQFLFFESHREKGMEGILEVVE